ncbi:MAG: type I phosphomannose isomerase catalytic subunit [Phycisphaeraceae bacterium]
MSDTLYPLQFDPIFIDKPWGGRRIESLGLTLPGSPSRAIGEAWLLVDLGSTASSHADHKPERSLISNGPMRGRSIHELVTEVNSQLLGRVELSEAGGFPLLVKFLDASENLSIQVHPSRAYAVEHPGTCVKYEAWYVIDAEPGSVIYRGLKPGVTPEQLRAALQSHDEQRIIDLLITVPVKPNECYYIPSGMPHALGKGILVAEVQTPSDTTFRLFDWDRSRMTPDEKAWHIEQGMQCVIYDAANLKQVEKRTHVAGFFTTVSCLIMCDYFRIEKVRMSEGYEQEITYDQPAVWIVLKGKGKITTADKQTITFQPGQAMLIPASFNAARIALDADTVWLEVSFPQAQNQLLA